MKRLLMCLMAGVMCVAFASTGSCQQPGSKPNPSSEKMPPEVCAAIEAYVAKVDAARSVKDKAERDKKYLQAKADLERVLKGYNKTSVLEQASMYASYSEQVVTKDPTDPQMPELLDKRLKLRATLLGMCSSYTITR